MPGWERRKRPGTTSPNSSNSAQLRRGACLDALVSAYLGEAGEGMKRLEAYLAAKVKDSASLYDAACVYSAASQAIAEKDRSQARLFVDRGSTAQKCRGGRLYELFEHADRRRFRSHSATSGLPGNPPGRAPRDAPYTAVWHSSLSFTSTEVHGLDPREHLARCRA